MLISDSDRVRSRLLLSLRRPLSVACTVTAFIIELKGVKSAVHILYVYSWLSLGLSGFGMELKSLFLNIPKKTANNISIIHTQEALVSPFNFFTNKLHLGSGARQDQNKIATTLLNTRNIQKNID